MSLGKLGGLKAPIHAPHPAAFHMPKEGGAPMRTGSTIKTHASVPRIHPAAAARVRLPDSGSIGADEAPFMPGVGKF